MVASQNSGILPCIVEDAHLHFQLAQPNKLHVLRLASTLTTRNNVKFSMEFCFLTMADPVILFFGWFAHASAQKLPVCLFPRVMGGHFANIGFPRAYYNSGLLRLYGILSNRSSVS